MSKSTKLATDTIVGVDMPVTPARVARPSTITVFGPTTLALQELAAHVRNGYCPDINSPVEVFGPAGTISIVLVLGNPDQAFIDRAAVSAADAVAIEEGRFNRLVEEAASRQVEAAEKARKQAILAAAIAEQKAAIAKLTAELDAQ